MFCLLTFNLINLILELLSHFDKLKIFFHSMPYLISAVDYDTNTLCINKYIFFNYLLQYI